MPYTAKSPRPLQRAFRSVAVDACIDLAAANSQSYDWAVDQVTVATLDTPQVRRLIDIAARWQLLARLAEEVSVMTDVRWEPVLLRTRDETHRGVLALVSMLEPAVPDIRLDSLERAEAGPVKPLVFGRSRAEVLADHARRGLVASRLLRPLLAKLPEESRTWWDARKIVDRLDFDARELLEYVRLVDPDSAAEVFAETE